MIFSKLYPPDITLFKLWHIESYCARYRRERTCNDTRQNRNNRRATKLFGLSDQSNHERSLTTRIKNWREEPKKNIPVMEGGAVTGRVSTLRAGSFRITIRMERSVIAGAISGHARSADYTRARFSDNPCWSRRRLLTR